MSLQPVIEDANVVDLSVGVHGAPTGWRAIGIHSSVGVSQTIKVVVICAPIG